MTIDQINAMSEAEFNEACATRAMGWTPVDAPRPYYRDANGDDVRSSYCEGWNPDRSFDDAFACVRSLLHKSLEVGFAMQQIINETKPLFHSAPWWAVFIATPRQIATAALLAATQTPDAGEGE